MLKQRHGFTLIELLIVVVIIGILAAIAIPKFSKTRERAYVSAMKSDLHNLATQQEIYYSGGIYAYTENLEDLPMTPSDGVSIDIATSDAPSWIATATHEGLPTGFSCVMYFGTVGTNPSTAGGIVVTASGVPVCDALPE
ncbi:MAG TPA: type II secretion system protein [Longimicrobiales bacterium]